MEKMDFPQLEEKILRFWKKNRIFKKSLEKRGDAPRFVFYEGPPYANGKPGIHHVLGRVYKDLFCRYKTMRGFLVERKAGWDTHGLPVEFAAEKELEFKTKKDIEKYGIDRFNQKCRENVWKYKDEWENITRRIGFWLDLEHPYITYDNNYIETLWWIIKQIYDKGFLVQDYRVAPYCPRCGTTLSSHELALGYKKIKEDAIYVKFSAYGGSASGGKIPDPNTYFLAWTTTPWTLPANAALAVHSNIDYVLIKSKGENLILAKEQLKVLDGEYTILQELKGSDLTGLEYEPLYKFIKSDKPVWRVVAGDFVSTREGTGIVHIAPAFGEDDMKVGKENNLPVFMTVDREGRFIDHVKPWAGKFVKDADPEIIDDLKKRNLLYKTEEYEHDYPFCWRCESPLLYYALTSWFIKIAEIKEKLLENNKIINWVPDYLKEGRFGEWLKEVKDWNFSRERYWGVPLPIWRCQNKKKSEIRNPKSETNTKYKIQNTKSCGNIKVIGSIRELERLGGKKIADLHRPYIDEIIFECEKCGSEMRRVPEVADIWFDSGAMPFASVHWPFTLAQNQKSQPKAGPPRAEKIPAQGWSALGGKNQKYTEPPMNYPADFICEGIDQTRGWFYTLLAVAALLGLEAPYKNVISYGHVLDKYGKKMSKSRGNAVEVNNVINKFGVDAIRWYFYTVNDIGMPVKFSEEDVGKTARGFISTFWNCYNFWKTYTVKKPEQLTTLKPKHILDKWLVSEFNLLVKDVTEKLDKYDLVGAARLTEIFLDNFSNWYLRRSRERIKNHDPNTLQIFYKVFVDFVKLLAPFIPFTSDYIFKEMAGQESVHLEEFPKADKKLIDGKFHRDMEIIRKIASMGLKLRVQAGIKVRQPLQALAIDAEIRHDYLELLQDEMNVKKILLIKEIDRDEARWIRAAEDGLTVLLDTSIPPQLKEEGMLREIIRHIQELRKKTGLTPRDKIVIYWGTNHQELAGIIEKNRVNIQKNTIAAEIKEDKFLESGEIVIDSKRILININKCK